MCSTSRFLSYSSLFVNFVLNIEFHLFITPPKFGDICHIFALDDTFTLSRLKAVAFFANF